MTGIRERIEVIQGDLTTEAVDAIVNAANRSLLGGGGVDGAIHHAGGSAILEACQRLNGCDTGDAKITTAGRLPARYVIHTVGPVYQDGKHGEPQLLARCYRRSMEVAVAHGLKTVAFPAISCGVYGYPLAAGAQIALEAVAEYLRNEDSIRLVRFVLFNTTTYDVFCAANARLGDGPEAR